MIEVLRFWLDLGIDGFRLDAVPYLYEREGTNCENLKETHEYLKRIRAEIDKLYPDKVLLAEANQWPADVVEYFGDPEVGGDECHMAFHFPLMPRIFMAVRREQRYPISEILAQTPTIPAGCQWGIFLRNHDELTLEMVTDDERDYMYAEYAKDPADEGQHRDPAAAGPAAGERPQPARAVHRAAAVAARLAGAVLRRRDRHGRQHLAGRPGRRAHPDAVDARTATAASPQTDPQRLYLPPIMDAIYGYQALNVEAQQRNPASFLHWTRRMIEIRKRHPVFGSGAVRGADLLQPQRAGLRPAAVARRIRDSDGSDRILCVNNLSRFPQPVELDLRRFMGVTPVECMGGVVFPPIGELSYLLTLPGHGFYWFQLPAAREERASGHAGVRGPAAVPRLSRVRIGVIACREEDGVEADHGVRGRAGGVAGQAAVVCRQGADRPRPGDRGRHRDHPRRPGAAAPAGHRLARRDLRLLSAVHRPAGPAARPAPARPDRVAGRPAGLRRAARQRPDPDAAGRDRRRPGRRPAAVLPRSPGPTCPGLPERRQPGQPGADRRAEQHQPGVRGVGHLQGVPPGRAGPQPGPGGAPRRWPSSARRTSPSRTAGSRPGIDGATTILAILSRYLRAASDGWSLAATSVRDLYALHRGDGQRAGRPGDRPAGRRHAGRGGDFAGEAERLGVATAQVHADLAAAFGTSELEPDALRELAEQMFRRLDMAIAAVPELGAYADKVGDAYSGRPS